MIPAKIHYCWYGDNPLPETALNCIRSWQSSLPGFEIKRWDESNLVVDCEFVKKAYYSGRWAFVSDYMRLLALYQEGGIYLDTDMLVLSDMNSFRKHKCFLGFENEHDVNAAIFGAEAGNLFIKKLIEIYRNINFDVSSPLPIPKIISNELQRIGFNLDNQLQSINEITVFPHKYFYPLPQAYRQQPYNSFLTENSYAVHLWDYSWMNEFTYFWKGNYREGFKKTWQTLKKSPIQPLSYYKDILYHLGRYFTS